MIDLGELQNSLAYSLKELLDHLLHLNSDAALSFQIDHIYGVYGFPLDKFVPHIGQ